MTTRRHYVHADVSSDSLVLLAAGTGLRMSELFALKWGDVHFETGEIDAVRSIVMQVVGPCKTEASQRPIPMDPFLADALRGWRAETRYRSPNDWVFASPTTGGRHPNWGQPLLRSIIRPAAIQLASDRWSPPSDWDSGLPDGG